MAHGEKLQASCWNWNCPVQRGRHWPGVAVVHVECSSNGDSFNCDIYTRFQILSSEMNVTYLMNTLKKNIDYMVK